MNEKEISALPNQTKLPLVEYPVFIDTRNKIRATKKDTIPTIRIFPGVLLRCVVSIL
jgi:hypothetical protein